MKTKIIKVLPLFFLTGCGSYSGSFDCPIGEGLKCASLSEVNQKVDQGALNMAFPSEKSDESCVNCKKVYWRSDISKPRVYHRKGR